MSITSDGRVCAVQRTRYSISVLFGCEEEEKGKREKEGEIVAVNLECQCQCQCTGPLETQAVTAVPVAVSPAAA